MGQWVNTKHMTREEATRFLLFEWANVMIWVLLILSTYSTIQRYSRLGFKAIDILVWSLLFGGAAAALVAIGGGVLAVTQARLDGTLGADAGNRLAELVLRMLGLPSQEAAEIAQQPLPPLKAADPA